MSWLSEGKGLFQSKTIWSLIASGVGYALPGVVDKLHLSGDGQSALLNAVSSVVTLGGLILAGAFRASATQPITGVVAPKV